MVFEDMFLYMRDRISRVFIVVRKDRISHVQVSIWLKGCVQEIRDGNYALIIEILRGCTMNIV